MRILILSAILVIFYLQVLGQNTKKLAASTFEKGNYAEAIRNYEKLLIADPHNGEYNHNIGVSYLRSNSHKAKAIMYLEEAEKMENYNLEVVYHLARAYHLNNEFDRAIETYQRYQKESGNTDVKINRHIGNCYSAKQLIKDTIAVEFVNLGPLINSEYPDYSPYVSKYENLLVFTSRRSGEKEFDGLYPSNIYE